MTYNSFFFFVNPKFLRVCFITWIYYNPSSRTAVRRKPPVKLVVVATLSLLFFFCRSGEDVGHWSWYLKTLKRLQHVNNKRNLLGSGGSGRLVGSFKTHVIKQRTTYVYSRVDQFYF